MYVFECTSTWNIGNRMLCLFFRNIHPSGKIVKLDKKRSEGHFSRHSFTRMKTNRISCIKMIESCILSEKIRERKSGDSEEKISFFLGAKI